MTREAGMSMYSWVKEDIKEKIVGREYKNGMRLPSERDLATSYNASRVTIRRAIDDLVNEGYLERKQGSGTYVRDENPIKVDIPLCGFFEEFRAQGINVKCEVIKNRYLTYEDRYAYAWKRLQEKTDKNLYYVERLYRCEDTGMLIIERNFFPEDVGKSLEIFNMSKDIIYRGLEIVGWKIDYAKQAIFCRMATEGEKKIMKQEKDVPVLDITRVHYTPEKKLVLFAEVVTIGNQYTFSVNLKR